MATARDLWAATPGFYTVWLAYLGRRYGLLERLAGRERTASQLSKALRLHRPAVEAWCSAAAAVGLLVRQGTAYRVPSAHRALLLEEEGEDYLAGQFEYAAAMSLDYAQFDALFRDGIALDPFERRRASEAAEAATRWDHTAFLGRALRRLPHVRRHLEQRARVLDIGCGAGGWMVRTALAFPTSEFVGVDPDLEALARARRQIERHDLEERVSAELGTAGRLDYRHEFDLAYLGEVLSVVPEPLELLKNVGAALKPGAHLVLLEGVLPEQPGPRDAVVAAMALDQALHGGRFYTAGQLRSILGKGRFRAVRSVNLGGGLWAFAADAPAKA